MFSVDPEVPSSITITDITQTHVTVSWEVRQTNIVNDTSVYYRATHTDSWDSVSATGASHTVTSLQPGTEYQFFVKITSYGKSASSANKTATTGNVVARQPYFVLNLPYTQYTFVKMRNLSFTITLTSSDFHMYCARF